MGESRSDQTLMLREQIDHSKTRQAECHGLWARTGTLTEKEKPEDTKIINWVADALYGSEPDTSVSIRVQWAEMSGDAHALGWQLLSRRTTPMTRTRSGLHETAVLSDLRHVAEPYLAAYSVLRRGWSYFDQRCTEP